MYVYQQVSSDHNPGYLFVRRRFVLPSDIGIIMNHCEDPYKTMKYIEIDYKPLL